MSWERRRSWLSASRVAGPQGAAGASPRKASVLSGEFPTLLRMKGHSTPGVSELQILTGFAVRRASGFSHLRRVVSLCSFYMRPEPFSSV